MLEQAAREEVPYTNVKSIVSTTLRPEEAMYLVSSNPELQSLELIEVAFIDNAAMSLGSSLNLYGGSLKNLTISECNLMDEQLGQILHGLVRCHEESLQPNSISLEALDISFNKGRNVSMAGLSQLVEVSRLRKLALGFQAFGWGRRVDLSAVLEAVSQSQHLQELDVGGNGLRDEDVDMLVTNLLDNNSIQVLDLSQNRFTNIGFTRIARSIFRMKNLLHLSVEDIKDIDEASIDTLAREFRASNNRKVHTIEISDKFMASKSWNDLSYQLDWNWSRAHDFENKREIIEIPPSLWAFFVERLYNPKRYGMATRVPDASSIIYSLLPGLLSHQCPR